MEKNFDMIVIGAGPGGYPAAIAAAKQGRRVAVVENRVLGGTCLNRGCIPTKTLLHTSGLYRKLSDGAGIGIQVQDLSVDLDVLWNRKEQVVSGLRDGIAQSFRKWNVELYQGTGTVIAPGLVDVRVGEETVRLQGTYILVCTGSRPSVPPIPGIDLPGVMDSDRLLEGNGGLFKHLLIIGGGVIGVEFATVYSDLGCRVTIVEAMERLLPEMDREISQNLKMVLKKRGVKVHTQMTVKEIKKSETGLVCLFGKDGEQREEADGILIATGRKPNTDGLFSAMEHPPQTVHGFLTTDDCCRTTVPGIYAVGDITGKVLLAHMATAQGLCAVKDMFGCGLTQSLSLIPSCVYTDPEIAVVGMTAEQAKEAGIPVRTGKYIMSVNGKSVLSCQERGFIKLVAHEETGRILGAQLMCSRATDMIGELALAIDMELTVRDLASVVMPHPTFGEGIGEAAAELVKE